VFWAAVVAQALVIALYFELPISYLWYNVIGCAACMALGLLFQGFLSLAGPSEPVAATP
jgi:hypothetical protein